MSTDLQEDLAEAIIRNKSLPRYKRMNKGDLIKSVGYGGLTAKKKPSEIIEAKGVKDALRAHGLTEELITTALVEDIEKKPQKRTEELKLGAEILGMKVHKESSSEKTLVVIIAGQSAERYGVHTA